jgi:hypothetical protein
VYALAAAGAWILLRDGTYRTLAIASMVIACAYSMSTGRYYMWWGGSSAPARFLVPVVPLAAPFLAASFGRLRGAASVSTIGVLLAISLLIAASGAVGVSRFLLFSDPHGISRLAEAAQGSAPLTAALPTFTEPDWPAPLLRVWPLLAAAIAALAAGRAAASRAGLFWGSAAHALTFLVVLAVFAGPFTYEAKADSVRRGRMSLIERFDPGRVRAFDFNRLAAVDPAEWLAASTIVYERNPTLPADPIGRVTSALSLPSGRYEARVWFQGQQPRDGAFQVALGRGSVLAREQGPLLNPAVLRFDMPVPVSNFWLQLTDLSAAKAVTKVEIVPLAAIPRSRRPRIGVQAVASIPGRPSAYLVHPDRSTFAEGATFWTRGTGAGAVVLAPGGADEAVLTLHVGPNVGLVRVVVGSEEGSVPAGEDELWGPPPPQVLEVHLEREETRTVTFPLPEGVGWVPITVQTSASFRPADVDPASTDMRELGCQVRIEVR